MRPEQLKLPKTIPTSDGLTVEGASPELLRELLGEYERILKRDSPHIWAALAPGLSRDQIVDQLATAGLPAPEELIIWWTWRNGEIPGIANGLRNPQTSLELAMHYRKIDTSHDDTYLPSQDWVRIAGEGMKRSILARCDPMGVPPLVRGIAAETQFTPLVTHAQARSLCTFVTWQLVAIQERWDRFDAVSGFWGIVDWEAYPLEWRLTGLA